jgi:hypothetical protein
MSDRIVSMPRASMLDDGSLIVMEFESETGNSTTLSFAPDDFEKFLSRATQLVTGAHNQKLSKGDHLNVHAVPIVSTMADAPIGGGKVILAFRADTGLLYHFAISSEEAENLRPQLFRAAKSARKQASKSRH